MIKDYGDKVDMTSRERLLDKIDNYIHKLLHDQKDKWDSGLKNDYYFTYDLVEDIEAVLDKWSKKI